MKITVESNQESITNHQTKIDEMDPKLNLVDETVEGHTVRIATLEAKVQSNQNRLTNVETNTDKISTLESQKDKLGFDKNRPATDNSKAAKLFGIVKE
jgi:septation ring formation regulator EzrA